MAKNNHNEGQDRNANNQGNRKQENLKLKKVFQNLFNRTIDDK